jgi:hypothetical protein
MLDAVTSTRPPEFGLCSRCAHQRLVTTTRGSCFSMCVLGQRDPDWPKYPAVPVVSCERFVAVPPTS